MFLILREDVNPREIVDICISDVLPQARKRDLELRSVVSPEVGNIVADKDKVRRIITNLLGNAVKFTQQGGTVSLRAFTGKAPPVGESQFDIFQPERNSYLTFEVEDTGIGIPEDKLSRVFDSFFQVDNSSTREVGGTGLGLSIARNFVHAHRGRIEVKSDVGKGTTFTVRLPYHVETPMSASGIDGLTENVGS